MKKIIYLLLYLLAISCTNNSINKSEKKETNSKESFSIVLNWPLVPNDFILGTPPGIGIDRQQNIFVFQRALPNAILSKEDIIQENMILMLDNDSGKLLASWGDNLFKKPHGLTVDQNDQVWVTDVKLQQVFKFSHDGKLLMTLGEKNIAGDDDKHFDQPTDVAIATDGSIYVTDGYGNNRVVKFNKEGEYLFEWGTAGDNEGEFNLPHAADVDGVGNIYVADRENHRIQMFDSNGQFIKLWADSSFGSIQSFKVDKAGKTIWAVDYKLKEDGSPLGSDIIIINAENGQFEKIAHNKSTKVLPSRYHDITFDQNGNLFTADILLNKIHKFTPTVSITTLK